ncbi:MAG: hypothetical protein DSZ10_05895 [Sulfurovum sp.]|nr:MAG: hypothetical protein DSZ10_05895 [Sulfurovum sp.]
MKKLMIATLFILGMMTMTACTTGNDTGMSKCSSGKCSTTKKCQASGKCDSGKTTKCQASNK